MSIKFTTESCPPVATYFPSGENAMLNNSPLYLNWLQHSTSNCCSSPSIKNVILYTEFMLSSSWSFSPVPILFSSYDESVSLSSAINYYFFIEM